MSRYLSSLIELTIIALGLSTFIVCAVIAVALCQ